MSLKAAPANIFSWRYEAFGPRGLVATIDPSWFREKAVLRVEGQTYELFREGLMAGRFLLLREGEEVASAEKMTAFRRAFVVQTGGHAYDLEAECVFGRSFLLRESGRVLGFVRPEGILSWRASIHFPGEIPLAAQVFMLALVVFLWKRQAHAARAAPPPSP